MLSVICSAPFRFLSLSLPICTRLSPPASPSTELSESRDTQDRRSRHRKFTSAPARADSSQPHLRQRLSLQHRPTVARAMAAAFVGKWKLSESENFDEFLKALGEFSAFFRSGRGHHLACTCVQNQKEIARTQKYLRRRTLRFLLSFSSDIIIDRYRVFEYSGGAPSYHATTHLPASSHVAFSFPESPGGSCHTTTGVRPESQISSLSWGRKDGNS